MAGSRRRLPHWAPETVTVFVTWRLAGTLRLRTAEARFEDRLSEGRAIANKIPGQCCWHSIATSGADGLAVCRETVRLPGPRTRPRRTRTHLAERRARSSHGRRSSALRGLGSQFLRSARIWCDA